MHEGVGLTIEDSLGKTELVGSVTSTDDESSVEREGSCATRLTTDGSSRSAGETSGITTDSAGVSNFSVLEATFISGCVATELDFL